MIKAWLKGLYLIFEAVMLILIFSFTVLYGLFVHICRNKIISLDAFLILIQGSIDLLFFCCSWYDFLVYVCRNEIISFLCF